ASIASLFFHPTTGNLIRLFKLQERLKSFGKPGTDPKAREPGSVPGDGGGIRHLHVVGAGAMGGDIAAWCALRGLTVTLQDLAPERIAPAVKRGAELFAKRLKQPLRVRDALDRLIPDIAGDGVAGADVIIEAIFENL